MNTIKFIIVVSMVLFASTVVYHQVYGQTVGDLIQQHTQEEKYLSELMDKYHECLMLKFKEPLEWAEKFTGNVSGWTRYYLEKVVTDCYDEGWIK